MYSTIPGSSSRDVVVGVGSLAGVVSMALLLAGMSAGDTRKTALNMSRDNNKTQQEKRSTCTHSDLSDLWEILAKMRVLQTKLSLIGYLIVSNIFATQTCPLNVCKWWTFHNLP